MMSSTWAFLRIVVGCVILSSQPSSLCEGHSSRRLPLAGIFGMGGKNRQEQDKVGQQPPQPGHQQLQQQQPPPTRTRTDRPPPPQGWQPPPSQYQQQQQHTTTFSRSASASIPPHLRNKLPRYPPPPQEEEGRRRQRPPPPPRALGTKPLSGSEPPDSSTTTTTVPAAGSDDTDQGVVEEGGSISNKKEDEATNVGSEKNQAMETNQTTSGELDLQPLPQETETPPPPPPPPPPLPQWEIDPNQAQMMPLPHHQQQQQGWMGPPHQGQYGTPQYDDDGWQRPYFEEGPNGSFLQSELEQSLTRETDLISQLDNLTAAVVVMEQREELHVRQLDVLTERVMDVEAQGAEDRNLLVEYEANCTAIGRSIAMMQEELEEWQQRCNEFNDRHEADQDKFQELERMVRQKQSEAEDLAIAIEDVRLAEKQRESIQSRRKSSRGGLLSWVFGFFVGGDNGYQEMSREDAYEMAKSTLLRALQLERGNVHELDAAVTALQQNNSAISEMVESRDSIIDELNNRISVFEEDKVVLKAALKQLQKEIKEETPKAQKLMDDLSKAGEEIKHLKMEINGVIHTHQDEVVALQKTLSSKQKAISDTESNLTAIGTYVDKLEERLTSFAVTRRDMEERERKCKVIEEAAIVTEKEKQELQCNVEDYSKEQEELKRLLEELAGERTTLQKENRKLYTEREFRIGEQEQLQAKCESLETESKSVSEQLYEWRTKCESLMPELVTSQASNEELRSRLEGLGDLGSELESSRSQKVQIEKNLEAMRADLDALKDENERLDTLLKNQTAQLKEQEERALKEETKPKQVSTDEGSVEDRDVPLRALRKKLAKVTGVHGLVTPSSRMVAPQEQQQEGSAYRRTPPIGQRLLPSKSAPIRPGPPPPPPPLEQ